MRWIWFPEVLNQLLCVCTTGSRTPAGIRLLFYINKRCRQLVDQKLSRKCKLQHSGSADPVYWGPLDLHRYHWLFWACPNAVWGCFRLDRLVRLGSKVPWMWQDAVRVVIPQTWRHTSRSEPATSNKHVQLKSTYSLIVGWSQNENPEWKQLIPHWSWTRDNEFAKRKHISMVMSLLQDW